MSTDAFVQGDGVRLATRDFGGSGSPLLYIPGAGCSLVDAEPIAPFLTGSHRLVGMDLRLHGLSGDGPWTWDAVLNDVRAVIAHYGLTDVTILGHSLGGMIAAMLTATGEVKAGINLDGHGMGTPDLYDGFTEEQFNDLQVKMKVLEEGALPTRLSGLKLVVLRAIVLRQFRKLGFSKEHAAQRLDRIFVPGPEGGRVPRLNGASPEAKQMMESIHALRLLDLYATTRAPLLVYNAKRMDKLPKKAPAELGAMLTGYRKGLARALSEVARSNPLVSYQEIDATHFLQLDEPQLVASQVKAFVAAA